MNVIYLRIKSLRIHTQGKIMSMCNNTIQYTLIYKNISDI